MKKIWKLAFAAFAFVAFTACDGNNETTTESENMETTDEMNTDLESDMEEDTVMLQDNTGNQGTGNNIQEEQPPRQ